MKIFVITLLALCSLSVAALADQQVRSYTRSDGTHVQGYTRSSPNNTVRDNYSYRGNTNPYTGNTGTNSYRNNPTSEYYTGPSTQGNSGYGGRQPSQFGSQYGR